LSVAACETKTETQIVTVTDTLVVTDTVEVEVDRPVYQPIPDGAAGFVGYRDSNAAPAQACGQCHASAQSRWLTTAHADAWAGLQGSGHAQEFCEGCHTVNALGNAATGSVGWSATQDSRYHDVGCESCHGAGQSHIDAPSSGGPLASLKVVDDEGNFLSCGECHNGSHHPFVEDWAQSPHANVVGFAAARESCAGCHRGQGALVAWGANGNYAEKFEEALPTTCGVCHDPHGSDNPGQTRFSAESSSMEINLCARCHNRRTAPDPESSHGLAPHAPQAALLLGEAGWFPPDLGIDQGEILGTHGSVANPRLCATCHVNSYDITDEATGEFVFTSTGHLFTAVPCTDEQGIPVAGDCAYNTDERTYGACTASGCHGTEQVAQSALFAAGTRIADRSGTILDLLWEVDPNLEEPGGEIDASDGRFTVAEGAFFNVNLAQFPSEGSTEPGDNPEFAEVTSASTHNPFLVEALLIGSQDAVEAAYGVGAAGAVNYWPLIQEILDKAAKHGGLAEAQ
jgi:predicted CXXCH cytochrome family protein